MTTPFESYITKVEADLRGGKATEHTYRGSLENFMEALERGIEVSSEPKHIECGAPDILVEKRKVPLGYVETKDLGMDLNKIEKSDQLKRYFKALHNLILTDYLEFRWYVNGEKKRTVRVASVGTGGRLRTEPNGETNLVGLFRDFYATETPTVRTAKELANRLAGVTHFIREQISEVLKRETLTPGPSPTGRGESDPFQKRYTAFKDLLLPALKEEEFADLYAQTMTYGLFAAKLSATPAPAPSVPSGHLPHFPQENGGGQGGGFTLQSAYQYLFGNKFLRRLFSDVSEELDEIEIVRPYLQDIVSLLNRARFEEILADFGKRTRTEDPVVHFYETFLAAYDPKMRESRGVYYTPEPVVQFIVNSADAILRSRFGRGWGLADPSVKVLDPATGTGTFLFYVIQKIHEEVQKRRQGGQWKEKSRELLRRVFGFELLIAPYVVSHLKLGLLLKTLGAPLESKDERLQIYLTNTLEEGVTRAEQLAGLGSYIAEEASDAAHVKKMQDIMVVLGNPPYSGHSANKGEWINSLLREYYFVDGAPLGERNPKWLQDDYVKFIRFGEWRIDQTGHGVLAFITNHGYLDNPTFRGMRQHLMKTFDEIYVLDLHGNSKKKEKTPEGGKDENVFDIQQGVAILLAVKNPSLSLPKSDKKILDANKIPVSDLGRVSREAGRVGSVRHAHLWGLREQKYATLHDSNLNDIDWAELQPEKPFYLFVPQDTRLLKEYSRMWKFTEIMTVYSNGIVTGQDQKTIAFTREQATQLAKQLGVNASSIEDVTYRPFDNRHIVYDPSCITRRRHDVMRHFLAGENIGLITSRLTKGETFAHAQVTTNMSEAIVMSPKTSNNGFLFPLYLYTTPEETAGTLFAQSETTRRANLAPEFVRAMEERLGMKMAAEVTVTSQVTVTSASSKTFSPEDVFYYAYAVFHSPTYRTRYAEFLKIDFPRLPLTSDKKLFRKLAAKGKELVELHLLKSPKVEEFVTSYPVAGDNKVEKVVYGRPDMSHKESDDYGAHKEKGHGKQDARGDMSGLRGRVWINASQYFGGVPENVWEFKVGGYQVCEKWLKDRKGRVLTSEEIAHYQRVVVALKETMRVMKEIDKAIVQWPME